jgi:hypothetical protein
MNCLECQNWLQQKLDGDDLATTEAVEHHWANCATCREQHAEAMRLLEGLKLLPAPKLAPDFAQRLTATVLEDRKLRRDKLRRQVLVTAALAASVLFLLLMGYYWFPRPGNNEFTKARPDELPNKRIEPAPLPQIQPKPPRKQEPRNALASLTERWVDQTRDHYTVVLVAANLDTVEKLPAVNELPPLDPGVREAGQEVSEGVRTVTRNARLAFDFFAREVPMPEVPAEPN